MVEARQKTNQRLPPEVERLKAELAATQAQLEVEREGRQRAETALSTGEQRYRSFIEASAQVVWTTNERGEVNLEIPAWQAYTGQSAEQARGFGWMEAIHPEDRERVARAWAKAFESQGIYEVEYRLRRFDGVWRSILARGVPVRQAGDGVREYVGTCSDITERKQGEEAARRTRDLLSGLIEATGDLVAAQDRDFRFLTFNAAYREEFCRIFGRDIEVGTSMVEALAHLPEDQHNAVEMWGRALRGETFTVTSEFGDPNLERKVFDLRFGPIYDAQGKILGAAHLVRDVTERVRAVQALRESEGRLRLFIENAPASIAIFDRQMRYLAVSQRWMQDYGLKGNLLGRSHYELFPELPGPWKVVHRRALAGESLKSEADRFDRADGSTQWIKWEALPWFTAAGEIGGIMIATENITARKRIEEELRRLKGELELRVEQRTAELRAANQELEAFTYSVSHDLRAPLRHIDNYLSILQQSAGPCLDKESREFLQIVLEAARRMGQLIDALLTFSRLGRAAMEERPVDLRQLVEAVRQELAPAMAGREIEWHLGPMPQVRGDANLLRSALTNLLGNAIKYTRQRHPAVIEVGSRQEAAEVICFVRDNGAGFDMRYVDKLFGVFQRLHAAQEFEGTGIGLASVRRVIQRHDGRAWAEGAPGKGATFYFSLPLSRVVTAGER